ncbi:hypothetical protein ACJ5NV_11000 [Loktanella agnita]
MLAKGDLLYPVRLFMGLVPFLTMLLVLGLWLWRRPLAPRTKFPDSTTPTMVLRNRVENIFWSELYCLILRRLILISETLSSSANPLISTMDVAVPRLKKHVRNKDHI